jgi:deoxycytidylate deaminase
MASNQSPHIKNRSKAEDGLPFDDHPELIFGLVGPIGVDLESVTDALTDALKEVGYEACNLRITELMREVKVGLDQRDFVSGRDPNDEKKRELIADVIDRLYKAKHLSRELCGNRDSAAVADELLSDESPDGLKESKVMDLLEFGRDIHAEMSAISDAARNGVPIKGATLYCTTFPCHLCAKHIVAAGIKRVVFIEPYPKSYAEELHSDSIEIDGDGKGSLVNFQRFLGISPYRYRDLFEKGKRKYSTGLAQRWNRGVRKPMIDVIYPSYFKAEAYIVILLQERLATIQGKAT